MFAYFYQVAHASIAICMSETEGDGVDGGGGAAAAERVCLLAFDRLQCSEQVRCHVLQ